MQAISLIIVLTMIVTVDVLVARMETIYKEENATIILEDVLNTNKIYAYSV